MSPAKSEMVINRPLSAAELSEVILNDFRALLARDGLLSSSSIGFGRCAYELRITLHLANPAYSEHKAGVKSRRRSVQEVAAAPHLAAIEPIPLVPVEPVCAYEFSPGQPCGYPLSDHPGGTYTSPDNPGLYHDWVPPAPVDPPKVHAVERHREIPSPNIARIQNSMPITVERRDLSGQVKQESVTYPKTIAENEGPAPLDIDVSDEARAELKIK